MKNAKSKSTGKKATVSSARSTSLLGDLADVIRFTYDSPVGPLFLEASPKGLRSLHFRKPPLPELSESELHALTNEKTNSSRSIAAQTVIETRLQLDQYFAGQRKVFTLPFDLRGTEFQKKVWLELWKIPFGKTVAYKDIATGLKNPGAVRAVGAANGQNPIAIIIPCHRVIAADGTLGGYAGGLSMKHRLLALEGLGPFSEKTSKENRVRNNEREQMRLSLD